MATTSIKDGFTLPSNWNADIVKITREEYEKLKATAAELETLKATKKAKAGGRDATTG